MICYGCSYVCVLLCFVLARKEMEAFLEENSLPFSYQTLRNKLNNEKTKMKKLSERRLKSMNVLI